MFYMLDTEFALVLYDGEKEEYIAASDSIGIRPLHYGYDKAGTILFAGEVKKLVGIADKIMPLPPSYYYKDREFVCYCDMTKAETVASDGLDKYVKTSGRNLFLMLKNGLLRM